MRRRYSHLDRVSKKREKRSLYIYLGILVFLIVFFALFGIQLFTRISLLLAPSGNGTAQDNGSTLVLVAPRLDPLDNATNSATISVSGYANEGETVSLSTETDIIEVLVGKDGTFVVSEVELIEGENRISATASKDKKESPASAVLTIVYKKTPPKLDITEPAEGKEFVGDDREVTIMGITDQDASITINDRFVRVEQDGSFSYTLQLPEGETTLSIVATDSAGNTSATERKVKYRP